MELFLRNMLLNEHNELHNRNMHISGLLKDTKVDIGTQKMDIETSKVDIETRLAKKMLNFSTKTIMHIRVLYEKFGDRQFFGRGEVMELLGLKSSGASKIISNMVQADVIEPVSGHGKGKYKFKEL